MRRRPFLRTLSTLTASAVGLTILNPFEVGRAVGSVYRTRLTETPSGPPDSPLANGSRRLQDGVYRLSYEWRDHRARQWHVDFAVDQTAYTDAEARSWGYLQAFRAARTNSHASRLGKQLADATVEYRSSVAVDSLTAADRLERAVRFVAGLEYVVDPDSKGIPEYHRLPEETLVDGRGDCKDLTYLLAGMLSQPPFGYRTAMVLLPEHMLVGVHHADLPVGYADAPRLPDGEHVAIESTSARPIGTFRDEPVLAIYDGGFRYVDHAAVAETTGQFLRDPTSFEVVANARTVPQNRPTFGR